MAMLPTFSCRIEHLPTAQVVPVFAEPNCVAVVGRRSEEKAVSRRSRNGRGRATDHTDGHSTSQSPPMFWMFFACMVPKRC